MSPGGVSEEVCSSPTQSRSRILESFEDAITSASGLSRRTLREQLEDGTPRSMRMDHIFGVWDVRGATRPITDFYEFVSTLGEGGYGVVQKWRLRSSWDGLDEAEVAVKLIRWTSVWNGCVRSKDQEKLIRNELKMLLVLDHPFIIKFREWFETPCLGIFFVMELCSGRSLQDLLDDVCALPEGERKGQMPRLRRHFREITYAVSYIHSMTPPVVHRDLKPDNVLLKNPNDPNSCVKLIDFGLACLRAHSGEDGTYQQGTLPFMAPEQFLSSAGDITQEMDNWSLGVIFAWIITALELGSLQHPMLPQDEGVDFEVRHVDLYRAYRDKRPWNRELFAGHHESAFRLADRVLVHDPCGRASATEILQEEWVRSGDPAAAAAAELLGQGRVIQNLMTYHQLGAFDKKILSLVADNANEAQVAMLRKTFRALDYDSSGILSRDNLINGFRSNDVELPAETVEAIFAEMDVDSSGTISYNEWLAATIGSRILRSEESVSAAFRCLDVNGNGHLRRRDLERAVGEQEAADVMQQAGVEEEESGLISYASFRRLLHHVADHRVSLQKVPEEPPAKPAEKRRTSGARIAGILRSFTVGAPAPPPARRDDGGADRRACVSEALGSSWRAGTFRAAAKA